LDTTSKVDQRALAGLWGWLPRFSERCGVGQEHLNKSLVYPVLSSVDYRKCLLMFAILFVPIGRQIAKGWHSSD
jgi:hypothetical protein